MPIRTIGGPRAEIRPRIAAGSLAAFASRMIFPWLSTTHTLLSFNETSIPT